MLSQKGQIIEQPADLFREPDILDFLKIPEPHHLSEADFETRLLDNLQSFLLEMLCKGLHNISKKKGSARISRAYTKKVFEY